MIIYNMKTGMHRLLFLLAIVAILLPPKGVLAGNKTVTQHYSVSGVCEKCKARIEKAAYDIKGVRFAEWNIDTHDFTIKYDSTKTSAEVILKTIAKAGHDNELFKADDNDYNKLPECCHYRSDIKKH